MLHLLLVRCRPVPGRIAFVPLRYGAQIVGGSEAVSREIAVGLAGRGWDVEVLTTRVIDHLTWANDLPEGATSEDGLTVRRFSTVPEWSEAGLRAQRLIQNGTMPPLDDQWTWVSWRWRAPDLFHHLRRHGRTFDAVVFSPYMFWNATACVGAVDNAIAMPCLHDEPYARLEPMRPVLARPRALWFLSEPEHRLAHTLGAVAEHHTVTGAGVHVPDGYEPERFRAAYRIDRPFLLYAGRREKDKGWSWLLDAYSDAVLRGLDQVDLVTIGSGEVEVPPSLAGRVRDLGFVSESDRNDAFAAALAYVQPSRMESFSRTVMEAWLAGTPVVAIEGSEVVGWHISRSGGGLTFGSGTDLADRVKELVTDPSNAASLAERGRKYVLEEYSWPVVLDRIEADLAGVAGTAVAPLPEPGGGGRCVILGSYPPIPRPASAVTLSEVESAWAAGTEVTVVSPRRSAADLSVPVAGLLAGRRLSHVARHTGARRLVLVTEPGFPLPAGNGPRPLLSAVLLARKQRRFEHVRLVRTAADGRLAARILAGASTDVVDALTVPPPGDVTPFGPPELPLRSRPMHLVRRLLGPRLRRILRRLLGR